MRKSTIVACSLALLIALIVSCSKTDKAEEVASYPAIETAFGSNIQLGSLINYAGQTRPVYITKDNTGANPITNSKATLGVYCFMIKI